MSIAHLGGWLDYDRPHLPALTLGDKIDNFEMRVKLVLINPLQRIFATEIHIEGSSALLIFGVSLCCAIKAVGKFVSGGQGGNGARFRRFIDDYMDASWYHLNLNGDLYGDLLWLYSRNGLAHGFAVRHGGFENNGGNYFAVKYYPGYDCVMINPELFYNDFISGMNKYLTALRGAPGGDPLVASFEHVFQDVFIDGL